MGKGCYGCVLAVMSLLITSLDWGNIYQGHTADVTIYVKNNGNQAAQVTVSSNLDPAVGTVTLVGTPLNLAAGGGGSATIRVSVLSGATTGCDVQ